MSETQERDLKAELKQIMESAQRDGVDMLTRIYEVADVDIFRMLLERGLDEMYADLDEMALACWADAQHMKQQPAKELMGLALEAEKADA